MKTSSAALAILLTILPNFASAGWLSDFVERGKLPSAPDAGLCVVNPAACVANEGWKESERQRQIQQENEALRNANARNSALLQQIASEMNSSLGAERQRYRSILQQGQLCFARALNVQQMDRCYANVQQSFLETQDSDEF